MDSGTAAIRVRTADLSKHRHLTSGGAGIFQLSNEVRACSAAEREQILSELHDGGFKVEVPVSQILGMKADLNIPWTKIREVRRYNVIALIYWISIRYLHNNIIDGSECGEYPLPVKAR